MDNPTYKLSANLIGHQADVRALAILADGRIVSASRDKTAIVWKPSGNGKDYVQNGILTDHANFVSSVCVINPSTQNPQGLILTGSNDNTICVYKTDEFELVQKIKAHQDTVCKLRASISEEGTFYSSSWDKTTKVWKVKDLSKPHLTLSGHTAAVWCVADLTNGLIATGSADKFVIVWSREGAILFKLSGHTDCVRDIISIKEDEFLTCANDATVRHWRASLGECLGSYSGHYNYIYSIAATPNGTYTYTTGEDRTVRVWYNGVIHQTINLPAQSIWCVDLLPNGDIVIGASDGIVRVFTASPERQADEKVAEEFEKQVAEVKLHAQLELGGMKIKDLPDARALQEPGKMDGQTKMVREDDVVRAYSWSQSQRKWVRIGDVMGASGCSPATSGKQLYEGKEYDYVFSIDIQDGVPPLKLPYNVDQDPWHVAQKFLHDHELSQLFLDQVANFIVKNSQQSAPTSHTDSRYADPFTGGSRYIPSSGNSSINSTASAPRSVSNTSVVSQSYIPHTQYLRLEQANFSTILEKLREFNTKQADVHRVPEGNLEFLAKLMENSTSESDRIVGVNVLNTLLNWPRDVVFPALDVARLAVLQKDVNEKLCTNDLLRIVKRHLEPNALVSNQMLTYRMLANMFCHEQGEKLGFDSRDEVLKALLDLPNLGNKNNQVAISTYLLNLIIALKKSNDTSSRRTVLNVIFALLPHMKESEATFRTLVGMGTLLATSNAETRNQLIDTVRQSEIAVNVLKTMSDTDTNGSNPQNKLVICSKEIIDLIL